MPQHRRWMKEQVKQSEMRKIPEKAQTLRAGSGDGPFPDFKEGERRKSWDSHEDW